MTLAVLLLAPCLAGIARSQTVKSNQHWLAEGGERIEAHGAGLLQSPKDGRWYWYGESKKVHVPNDVGVVNCYSSDSLNGPWRFEGEALTQGAIDMPWKGPWILERPKVLYNDKTNKFVMWFHLDLPQAWWEQVHPTSLLRGEAGASVYIVRKAAVATADSAAGPFTFVAAWSPDEHDSTDMNLFKDPLDGRAYFLRHCGAGGVFISGLTDDYLNTTGVISRLPESVEGMAMFRLRNGTYYVLSSHLTGWEPNPMVAWRSKGTTLQDAEWENIGNPTGHATSFDSQPTYVVEYTPAEGDPFFVYMGDNWVRCGPPSPEGRPGMLPNACYVWLPIQLDGPRGPLRIDFQEEWSMEDPFGTRAARLQRRKFRGPRAV